MAAEHAGAKGVEGAEPKAFRGAAEDGSDAFAHFAGRLVGEGNGQDLAGCGPAREQDVGKAGGEHAGLAGAGAGEDQDRAIDGLDGLALLGVQAFEVIGHGGAMRVTSGL